jgi:hypothetical protein
MLLVKLALIKLHVILVRMVFIKTLLVVSAKHVVVIAKLAKMQIVMIFVQVVPLLLF